jgi:hypothetical protein
MEKVTTCLPLTLPKDVISPHASRTVAISASFTTRPATGISA